MIDYYLKFKNQKEADKVLANIVASIDVIGEIYKPTGKLLADEDGNEYPELKALTGYHVNLRFAYLPITYAVDAETGEYVEIPSTIPDALAPYIVEPTSPSRVWA